MSDLIWSVALNLAGSSGDEGRGDVVGGAVAALGAAQIEVDVGVNDSADANWCAAGPSRTNLADANRSTQFSGRRRRSVAIC